MTNYGIINILKPPGISSHSVVNKVRKILNTKKVGHTGTLDPDAVGVLPICVGKATRLSEYLLSDDKTYRALIAFGRETDTQDALGETTHEANLPNLNRLQFEALLQDFVGEIEQIPPMYSAIKKNGQPLYKLAREGKVIEREARKVRIHTIKLLSFDVSSALIEVSCSKGTYIRTLCQDIGRAAGSAAHMSFLLRTKSGNFCINDAVTLEEIAELNPSEYFINPLDYLENMPKVVVTDAVRTSVLHGNKFSISDLKIDVLKNEKYLIIDKERNLLALGSLKGNCIQPEKVFG